MFFLIVGLGNPGKDYQKTRHNIGFMVIDHLAERHKISLLKKKFQGFSGSGQIANQKVLLLKPQTFMNLSGESVSQACQYYDLPPDRIAVIHDDIDLELGRIQVRQNGGHGGHRGLISIYEHLQSKDFIRFRIGVARPLDSDKVSVSGHVLGKFRGVEPELADIAIDKAVSAVEDWLKEGLIFAMNKYNPWSDKKRENKKIESEASGN